MESRLINRPPAHAGDVGVPLHGKWRPGEGTPIIVVPGAMADAESYTPVVDAMEGPEPVLLLDRRGRSASGAQGAGYSTQTEVDDLRAWLDHLGVPVTLVGWSYGATIALELAAHDPRVRHVIGYEPVIAPFGLELLPALRVADLDTRVEIINRDLSRVPAEAIEELRASAVWPALRRLAEPALAELEAINSFRPSAGWAALTADLIIGEHSQGSEPYGPGFARAAERLPRAITTVLPGQGHLAHVEDPTALGKLITILLANRPQQPQPDQPEKASAS